MLAHRTSAGAERLPVLMSQRSASPSAIDPLKRTGNSPAFRKIDAQAGLEEIAFRNAMLINQLEVPVARGDIGMRARLADAPDSPVNETQAPFRYRGTVCHRHMRAVRQ